MSDHLGVNVHVYYPVDNAMLTYTKGVNLHDAIRKFIKADYITWSIDLLETIWQNGTNIPLIVITSYVI